MSSSKLEALRTAIADESIPLSERRTAAEHYVAEMVDAIPAPAEDNAEVAELVTPWTDGGTLGSFAPMAWKQHNLAYGWRESGPTVAQAIKRVHDRLRLRVMLGVVVDENAHHLERLEACRRVLDELHPQNFYRRNGYDAERMLAKVLPATATKYAAWDKPPAPVERPPQTLADVW
jgi:hypothetical protein